MTSSTVEIGWPCHNWDCGNDVILLTTEADQADLGEFSFWAFDGDKAVCPEYGAKFEVSADAETAVLIPVDDLEEERAES